MKESSNVAAATNADNDDEYEDVDFISLVMGEDLEWDNCPGPVLIEHLNGSI